MSCLSFFISASVSEQINLYKMPEAEEMSITTQARPVFDRNVADALNNVGGDNTKSKDEKVHTNKA